MPDYMAPIFAEHEARYAAAVQGATWGHLAPEPRRYYTGHLIFADTCFDGVTAISYDFKGLDDSPWLYEDLHEFMRNREDAGKLHAGCIYRFDGTYVKFKNGGFRFSGKVRRVRTPKRQSR